MILFHGQVTFVPGIKEASNTVPFLSEITDRAVLRKARSISADSPHPLELYNEFRLLPSARRFLEQ